MSHSKEEKLEVIYNRVGRQLLKSWICFILAICLFGLAVGGSTYLMSPYDVIVAGVLLLLCVYLFVRFSMLRPSYEKRLFRKIYAVYRNLSEDLKISDASTLKKRNLDFAIVPLYKISRKLGAKPLEGTSDLIAEINRKYVEISADMETRIIAYLQRKKDVERVKRRILKLADVFSDANMGKIYSYLKSLKEIQGEEFQSIPSQFDKLVVGILSNPLIRIVGELLICLSSVTIVAYFLSIIFSISIENLVGYILIASFTLLATWEARRK